MKKTILFMIVISLSTFSFADEKKKNNPTSLSEIAEIVKRDLKDIDGINVEIENGEIFIKGKVLLPRDLDRVYAKASQFDNKVVSLVEINPLSMKKIAAIIESDINNPNITVAVVDGNFILRGKAKNHAEKSQAEIIAKTYVPGYNNGNNLLKRSVKKIPRIINLINS